MECKYCGCQVFATDRFCIQCGAPIRDSNVPVLEKKLTCRNDVLDEYENSQYSLSSCNDYIKVVSLTPNKLNISTKHAGTGKVYSFENIGSSKLIPVNDLLKIVNNMPRFTEEGIFLIMNKQLVSRLDLTSAYAKILANKEPVECQQF